MKCVQGSCGGLVGGGCMSVSRWFVGWWDVFGSGIQGDGQSGDTVWEV